MSCDLDSIIISPENIFILTRFVPRPWSASIPKFTMKGNETQVWWKSADNSQITSINQLPPILGERVPEQMLSGDAYAQR